MSHDWGNPGGELQAWRARHRVADKPRIKSRPVQLVTGSTASGETWDASEQTGQFELDQIPAPSGFSRLLTAALRQLQSFSFVSAVFVEMKGGEKKTPTTTAKESHGRNLACIHINTHGRALLSSRRCLTDADFCHHRPLLLYFFFLPFHGRSGSRAS